MEQMAHQFSVFSRIGLAAHEALDLFQVGMSFS